MEGAVLKSKYISGAPLVIITGLSGAGKTAAMRFLEDLGCYCVDNLPPILIPEFFNLYEQSFKESRGVVVACDIRSGDLFEDFTDVVNSLAKSSVDFKILYLDCNTETLMNRFNEVRRRHPLQTDQTMRSAVEEERARLEPIKKLATCVVDTSDLDVASLRERIIAELVADDSKNVIEIKIVSFGFKYGVPNDVDFAFDVRFLKNPHYEKDLRNLTGNDQPVYDYVMSDPLSSVIVEKIAELIELTLVSFVRVGKTTINIAVGCTGGRHRSVTIAKALSNRFAGEGRKTRTIHRDVSKPAA